MKTTAKTLASLFLVLAIGNYAALGADYENLPAFPAELKGLPLGMQWADFLNVRTNATKFTLAPKSERPPKPTADAPQALLIETLDGTPETRFKSALYCFDETSLAGLCAVFDIDRANLATTQTNILRTLTILGAPDLLIVNNYRVQTAQIVWLRSDIEIELSFPVTFLLDAPPLNDDELRFTAAGIAVRTLDFTHKIGLLDKLKTDQEKSQTAAETKDVRQQLKTKLDAFVTPPPARTAP